MGTSLARASQRMGLVMTGGGARAAYQAGVLKGIAEVIQDRPDAEAPFQCVTGLSAGGINAAFVASKMGEFQTAAALGCDLWRELKAESILDTRVSTISRLAAQWGKDLALGGAIGGGHANHLLSTEPLKEILARVLSFEAIRKHLDEGTLHSFALSATNYKTGSAMTFYDGPESIQPWVRSSRIGVRARLTLDHVLASSAIPILFRPVTLDGSYFGDGGIRMRAPLSPAIHLGSEKILAIGIRYVRPGEATWEMNQAHKEHPPVTLADIAGVLMNATFLDSLESDVERFERINHTLSLLPKGPEGDPLERPEGLRAIPLLVIQPSQDLGRLASHHFSRLPRALRYMMRGLGASEETGWDMISYLAFDGAYTGQLIDLGYQDALSRREEIRAFFAL